MQDVVPWEIEKPSIYAGFSVLGTEVEYIEISRSLGNICKTVTIQ